MYDHYYTSGTVDLVYGSTAVVGTGTAFETALVDGGMFVANGLSVPIASVESETELTLLKPWPGDTLDDQPYSIGLATAIAASAIESNRRLGEIVARLDAGSFLQPDATGTLAERDAYDGEAQGFIYVQSDVSPFVVFIKESATSGDWSAGTDLVGPAGAQGDPGLPGIAGEGFNPVGIWDVATTYAANDFVSFGTRTFVSLQDANLGNEPPSTDADDAFWMFVPTAVGPQGDQVELQVSATHIQWRYVGDATWNDLILLSELEGPQGAQGDPGPQGDPGDSAYAVAVANGFVGDEAAWIASLEGDQGDQGIQGDPGVDGEDGWTPILATVNDGERRVNQVVDWTGGTGTKPATGKYVGPTGLVDAIGDGVDIRGPSGSGTGDVTTTGAVTSGRLARFADGTGDVLEDSGKSISDFADAAAVTTALAGKASTSHTHAQSDITDLTTDLAAKAPLADPAFTGNPTAPTQTAGNNSTRLATTAFVTGALTSKADLNSPALTGTPTAPTPTAGDNDTSIATTAFVAAALAALVDSSPGTLDTLNELAAALGDDPNFATTITTSLSTKANLSGAVFTGEVKVTGGAIWANRGTLSQFVAYNGWGNFSSNASGEAVIGTNLYTQGDDSTYRTKETHASLGYSAVRYPGFGAAPQITFAGGATTSNAAVTPTWHDFLLATLAGQSITGGAAVITLDLGNLSGQTITPAPSARPIQKITNNGAGTIAPNAEWGVYLLVVKNTTGAGAITTSSWTNVDGDPFTTSVTAEYLCHCTIVGDFTSMTVKEVTA